VTAYDLHPITHPFSSNLHTAPNDISDEFSIVSCMEPMKLHFGPIHILIANAGTISEADAKPIWRFPLTPEVGPVQVTSVTPYLSSILFYELSRVLKTETSQGIEKLDHFPDLERDRRSRRSRSHRHTVSLANVLCTTDPSSVKRTDFIPLSTQGMYKWGSTRLLWHVYNNLSRRSKEVSHRISTQTSHLDELQSGEMQYELWPSCLGIL
jgi:hypothetical protein